MSARLGSALAAYLREQTENTAAFVLVEGVPTSVAAGISSGWDDDSMPRLAVVSADPAAFGRHALVGVSGTQLRNEADDRGVVLVLCEGRQLPDRQSLNLFESVSPSVLLETRDGLALLAAQPPAVEQMDGWSRAVRVAVIDQDPAARPSPAAVSAYLDKLAAGGDPLRELPTLGAFADSPPPGETADSGRVANNLALAARRRSEDFLRSDALADFRRRASAILGRRQPPVGDLKSTVADVMADLQQGRDALLEKLSYDEARDLFDRRPKNLTQLVKDELHQFRADAPPGSQAEGLPWQHYDDLADNLAERARQREAAREICDLDDAHQRTVFKQATRRKLERSLADRAVDASNPSCPEAAIARAAEQLGGLVHRVELMEPKSGGDASASRTSAGRTLTLACARLRLGGLFNKWADLDEDIDGQLTRSVDDEDLGGAEGILAALADANLSGGGTLPALKLRLHADDEAASVQITWRPDFDDVALLLATLLFADETCLTLRSDTPPTLEAFCSGRPLVPVPPPTRLKRLALKLRATAQGALEGGLTPALLNSWVASWTETAAEMQAAGDEASAGEMALAGAVQSGQIVALSAFAPMKSEWLAQHLDALWALLEAAEDGRYAERGDATLAASGIARTTAAHHPAYLRLRNQDRPLLPASEGRIWSLYGSSTDIDEGSFNGDSLHSVLTQLLTLQPEAAGHLRCLAWGPGAADLLAGEALKLITGPKVGAAHVRRVEIFCVGDTDRDKPSRRTLDGADDQLGRNKSALQLRYMETLDAARDVLAPTPDNPAVHFALVTGITQGGRLLNVDTTEVAPPALDPEVLFAPRLWQRPGRDRRVLLMPPAATSAGRSWLALQQAVTDSWPAADGPVDVPEIRTGTFDIRDALTEIHGLALWVATLDRYATRDSLEQALGRDNVAILHQERRLGGESPVALVLSQKSGGPADRAIGRSLRAAQIVTNPRIALSIGTELRKVASQGYGILALQAATSGAGINELVGHVVAFSMLATKTTPWPLPPGCRVLLVSLDEYRHWFRSKRADLLAIALDPRDDPSEGGVHVAVIEVKARRSDETNAKAGALDQLQQTISATRWAAQPDGSIYSRLWLNRIAEAAYSVARESRFRLDEGELAALENFRLGKGSLEWAGVGLVFSPHATEEAETRLHSVGNDLVPVVLHSVTLTEQLLRTATGTDLTKLRTVETERAPLQSTRIRRRPETKNPETEAEAAQGAQSRGADTQDDSANTQPGPETTELSKTPDGTRENQGADDDGSGGTSPATGAGRGVPPDDNPKGKDENEKHLEIDIQAKAGTARLFIAPVLGWDGPGGPPVTWHPAGPGQDVLQNGHVEIWGSSGMGKTQFVMSLLAQLGRHSGSHIGILDFKNDYSGDTGFPAFAGAEFLDLWDGGAPYNPLALSGSNPNALPGDNPRAEQAAVIELRDTVDEATRAFTHMGSRQRRKLQTALEAAYRIGAEERRWPTLRTLGEQLDDDLHGIIGDLTSYELFRAGQPLGEVVNRNVVFGLSRIPGNGQTTVFAAGFILSSLLLRVQNLPPVPNTIRYVAVVDEAHRVAAFRAITTMIREGRSKGLSVILATQQPLDLPDIVGTVAQTKICFGLPDSTAATIAARKLDPHNSQLPGQIRTLGVGEAYVSFAGQPPRLLRMAQAHRDAADLSLPELRHPQ